MPEPTPSTSITRQLQTGAREFVLPADLVLATGETLACEQVLRALPGKRVVMKAQRRGRPVLVKLMADTASGRRNARREMAGHSSLKAAQIDTPDLLLAGHAADGGRVLVFEFVERAQRVGELPDKPAHRRAEIGASVLTIIASLHRHGCIHSDPHLHNFLLANGRLSVVDVESVKRLPIRLAYGKWQRENLARFVAMLTPSWREIVTDALATNYPEAAADPKLPAAVVRARHRNEARYLKKCFRECSPFATRKNWRRSAVWRRDRQSADLESFLQNPDAWMAKGETLPDDGRGNATRVSLGGRPVIITRRRAKNILHILGSVLGETQSRTDWRNAHRFNRTTTREPVAFVEIRRGPFCIRDYYVCDD